MSKRTNRILELLTDKGQLEVSSLADLLDVSKVTIRKDLNELEQKGIIVREHGLAVLRSRDDINGRMAYHYEEKKKIAAEAAKLVNDGDTIIIESGASRAARRDADQHEKRSNHYHQQLVYHRLYTRPFGLPDCPAGRNLSAGCPGYGGADGPPVCPELLRGSAVYRRRRLFSPTHL